MEFDVIPIGFSILKSLDYRLSNHTMFLDPFRREAISIELMYQPFSLIIHVRPWLKPVIKDPHSVKQIRDMVSMSDHICRGLGRDY